MHIAVPTVTVIAHKPSNYLQVVLVKPASKKHGDRPVLVGGKIDLTRRESKFDAMKREWKEEAGGKGATLVNLELGYWAARTDLYVEPRPSMLSAVTHQGALGLVDQPITALYACPDYIFTAPCTGDPWPNDPEVAECFWFDLNNLRIAPTAEECKFGGQHDLILGIYLHNHISGVCGLSSGEVTKKFENSQTLRAWLRRQNWNA